MDKHTLHNCRKLVNYKQEHFGDNFSLKMQIITTRKRSLGQDNVFIPPGQTLPGTHPLADTSLGRQPSDTTGYGQQTCGMHPTDMHTCYHPQCSCGKVMFSQASVILSTGGRGCVADPHPLADPSPCRHPLDRHPQCMLGYTPPGQCIWDTPPTPMATATDDTHPTGMHSCISMKLVADFHKLSEIENRAVFSHRNK